MNTPLSPETLAELLADIAPDVPGLEAIIQVEDHAWTLGFEDETAILVEWVGNPGRVVLSADLGCPPESHRMKVLQMLLSYNALWRHTDGIKGAQGGDDGDLLLIHEWHNGRCSSAEALPVFRNFTNLVKCWRLYVSGVAQVGGDFPADLNRISNRA